MANTMFASVSDSQTHPGRDYSPSQLFYSANTNLQNAAVSCPTETPYLSSPDPETAAGSCGRFIVNEMMNIEWLGNNLGYHISLGSSFETA